MLAFGQTAAEGPVGDSLELLFGGNGLQQLLQCHRVLQKDGQLSLEQLICQGCTALHMPLQQLCDFLQKPTTQ